MTARWGKTGEPMMSLFSVLRLFSHLVAPLQSESVDLEQMLDIL